MAKVLKEHKIEIDRLSKEKFVEVEHLQEVVWSAEQASTEVKEELALEVERRKKVEVEVVEKEKQILESKDQAILDFKASKEMEDMKIDFVKIAFIKRFKLF